MTKKTTVLVAGLLAGLSAHAATYFVDASGGLDGNSGTSTNLAWQTLAKVSTVTFQPGDEILFKAGEVWNNEQLLLNGSGVAGNPILVDRYGTGADPVLNGGGIGRAVPAGKSRIMPDATVVLRNVEYWEIQNLEITNDDDFGVNQNQECRAGILVWLDPDTATIDSLDHVYISDCTFHDVDATMDFAGCVQACVWSLTDDPARDKYLNDIRVENCTFYDSIVAVDIGWHNKAAPMAPYESTYDPGTHAKFSTGVYIGNNYAYDMTKGGFYAPYTDGAVVEYNTMHDWGLTYGGPTAGIYPYWGQNGVWQHNEVSTGPNTGHDGAPWDVDANCSNVWYQFNYSYNNPSGWTLAFVGHKHCGMRYNLSVLDGDIMGKHMQPGYSKFYILNNVFYYDANSSTVKDGGKVAAGNFLLANNVFYNINQNTTTKWNTGSWIKTSNKMEFINNAIYEASGNYSGVPVNETVGSTLWIAKDWIMGDPRFVSPGVPGSGTAVHQADGFKLQADSPLIDTGLSYDVRYQGTADYFGTPLGQFGPLDIGLHEVQVFSNGIPAALAGPDRTVADTDLIPGEDVLLDGSLSVDGDGFITNYVWMMNGSLIATGSNVTVRLPDGLNTITLIVTDNDGKTDTDSVDITVTAYVNAPPVANAGPDQSLVDTDGLPGELVLLDGSGSTDSDGTITGYEWSEGGTVLSTNESPTLLLSDGSHTLTLTVTDNNGDTGSDTVQINVNLLLINGGFELPALASGGTTLDAGGGWIPVGGNQSIHHDTWATRSGLQGAWLKGWTPNLNQYFYQDVAVAVSNSYRLEAWFKANDNFVGNGSQADLALIWLSGADVEISRLSVDVDSGVNGTSWTQFTLNGTAPAGTVSARVQVNWSTDGAIENSNQSSLLADDMDLILTALADADGDGMPDVWETANGLDKNTPDASGDKDGDGLSNHGEYIAGTLANDANSVFAATRESTVVSNQFKLVWPSVAQRQYSVSVSSNLIHWVGTASNIVSTPPTNQWMYVRPVGMDAEYFRIHVQQNP